MVDLDRLNEPLKAFKRIDNEMDAPEDWVTVEEALNAYRDYLADPVAAAANLDGAERISELPKTCKHGQTTMHDHPNGESRCAGPIAEANHYLRIPLPDKETPHEHEWVDARNQFVSSGEWCPKCNAVRAVPDKETPNE